MSTLEQGVVGVVGVVVIGVVVVFVVGVIGVILVVVVVVDVTAVVVVGVVVVGVVAVVLAGVMTVIVCVVAVIFSVVAGSHTSSFILMAPELNHTPVFCLENLQEHTLSLVHQALSLCCASTFTLQPYHKDKTAVTLQCESCQDR